MKSFLLNFRVPAALLAALEKNVPKKEFSAFSRLAVAEKLARDFGEQLDASALAVRVGQGRRTDLERLRKQISAARAAEKAAYERFCLAAEKALKPRRKRGDKAAGK